MEQIPLDKNESYWLLTKELTSACSKFDTQELSTYPDYTELRSEIAAYSEVTPAQVCVTAGSDAIIETIARTLIPKTGSVVLPVPTFYGYENILMRNEVSITPVFYIEANKGFIFPIEETLEAMNAENITAVFLCHPNNPLGPNIPETDLHRILEKTREKNIFLISDEAYFEYGGKTLVGELSNSQNLIIIRTFSKAFGLSGARVGYCMASIELAEKLQKQLLPWPVAHISSSAAIRALENKEHFKKRRELYIDQRAVFKKRLAEIPEITTYSSETNFLLLRVPDDIKAKQYLDENGIKVALGSHMSKYPEAQELLKSTLRVAIPSPNDIDRVVESIREAVLTK